MPVFLKHLKTSDISLLGLSWQFISIFSFIAGIFLFFPQIDIWVTSLFFNPSNNFYLKETPFILFLYQSVKVLTIGILIILVILLIGVCIKNKPALQVSKKQIVYLLLVLLLGPGLIVNVVFKKHWGRARPCEIVEFGGSKVFTPAFVVSNENGKSFVSGHAAVGFYFISFAMLLKRHRKKVFTIAVAYGTLVGVGRIAQGDHFLSDVIFSFFFVYCVAKILYYWMFEKVADAK
jgi:lipid A 4'-phosphatase